MDMKRSYSGLSRITQLYATTVFVAAILVTTLPVLGWSVEGHGDDTGAVVAQSQLAGNDVAIWLSPTNGRPGEIHIDTIVSAADGQPINCLVTLEIVHESDPTAVRTVAASASTPATGFRHVAALILQEPGRYSVDVTICENPQTCGLISFPLEIAATPLWVKVLLFAALAFTLLFGVWLLYVGWSLWISSTPNRYVPA